MNELLRARCGRGKGGAAACGVRHDAPVEQHVRAALRKSAQLAPR